MVRARESVEVPDLKAAAGSIDVGGQAVVIYNGQLKTLQEARGNYRWENVLAWFRKATGMTHNMYSYDRIIDAFLGHVLVHWYIVRGHDVPAQVTLRQEKRMTEAAEQVQTEGAAEGSEKPAKEKRVTIKSLIERELLARTNPETGELSEEDRKAIEAEIQAQFPDSAAAKEASKHIAYYRHFMQKNGVLVKPAKKARPAKAEKEGGEGEGAAEGSATPAETEPAPTKRRRPQAAAAE